MLPSQLWAIGWPACENDCENGCRLYMLARTAHAEF